MEALFSVVELGEGSTGEISADCMLRALGLPSSWQATPPDFRLGVLGARLCVIRALDESLMFAPSWLNLALRHPKPYSFF